MSVSLLRRRPSDPSSTERAALAAIVAETAEAIARRSALESAVETARQNVIAAGAAVADAHAAIEGAKESEVAAAIAEARGAPPAPFVSIEDARAALAKAEEQRNIRQAAHEALQAELAAELGSFAHAHRPDRLKAAASAVVAAECGEMAARDVATLVRLQRELVTVFERVQFWVESGAIPLGTGHGPEFGRPADEASRAALNRMGTPPGLWTVRPGHAGTVASFRDVPDGAAALRAALDALMRDAAAPLPVRKDAA